MRSRRRFIQASALTLASSAAGISLARAQAPRMPTAPADGAVTDLGGGLSVLTAGGANVVLLHVTDGAETGSALVDGVATAQAERLLGMLAEVTGARAPHTLFNTHWHPEHTGLNERFGAEGARIVAHENTRLWLGTDITWPWGGETVQPLPQIGRPNETFYDRVETEVLGRPVEYGHLRDCPHTDGDMYVRFTGQNVIAAGGAISPDAWPLVDWWTGGWMGGLVGGHAHLLYMADENTRFVPASGPVISYAQLEAQHEMYSTIWSRLSDMLYAGRGSEEAVAAGPAREFDDRMGNSDDFVRQAFQSAWAYLSPDA